MLGSEAFRQELLAAVVERVGPSHYGAPRQDTGLQQAERMVSEESERLGWAEDQLRARRKGHRVKVLLARRRRQATTRSLQWLAQRLQRGSLDLCFQPAQGAPTNAASSAGGVAVVSIVRTDTCTPGAGGEVPGPSAFCTGRPALGSARLPSSSPMA